jgi:hypothetical protein
VTWHFSLARRVLSRREYPRWAEPAPLAAESQLVVAALCAASHQETVGQDAALKEGVELVFDDPRSSQPVLASVCAKKLTVRCCTRPGRLVCSGRRRS